jgi:hypothetical protein
MSVFKRGGVYWYGLCFGGREGSDYGFGEAAEGVAEVVEAEGG